MLDPNKYKQGIIVENKRWTEHLFSLCIEVEINPFEAGQFGRVGVVLDGEGITRPYSFVNAPDEKIKEFYAIVVPEGPLTAQLVALKPGDPAWVGLGANGFLKLSEVPQGKHLWLVSSGTGLGPFLSILKTPEPWGRFEKIILIHAVRKEDEATYRDTMKQFEAQYGEQFMPIHFISREATNWAFSGRIPAAIENGQLEEKARCKFSAQDSQVMICGNPEMVKDVSAILQARGLARNRRKTPGNISVETYW